MRLVYARRYRTIVYFEPGGCMVYTIVHGFNTCRKVLPDNLTGAPTVVTQYLHVEPLNRVPESRYER
jgi:hypothetical protein